MTTTTTESRAYQETLPARERRLADRLEVFGDIVFGFAVSQCAVQLPTQRGHVELDNAAAIAVYFGTYALIASFWLTYHRLMSGPFRPARLDMVLAFAYLALVSLMPYALYGTTHERGANGARDAVAVYAILFAGLLAIAAALTWRNLERGGTALDDEDRELTWRGFVRRCTIATLVVIALIVDETLGPAAASVPFFAIAVAVRIIPRVVGCPARFGGRGRDARRSRGEERDG